MAPVRLNRRRLALLTGGVVACVVIVLLTSRDGTPAAQALNDQLESALWRDSGPPEEAEEEDAVGPPTRVQPAGPAAACHRRLQIGIIFTKADQHPRMKANLVRLLQTMAAHTADCANFNMFTDRSSEPIIERAFAKAGLPARFTVTNHPIAPMADQMKSLIEVMQEHFAPRKGTYYNDVLFFLTTTMHRSLPQLDRIIMMDIDVSVRADLALLDRHFDQFAPTNVMGLSLELSPVYRHVLAAYREAHANTTAGGAPPAGFPGLNSGVVLLDLARMRASRRYNALLTADEIRRRVAHYQFKGHLGDQDLYTLLALDDPQLFYVLPCGWNRQLCTFWRSVYADVFDEYFRCDGAVSIYHGNCKAAIPTEGERRL